MNDKILWSKLQLCKIDSSWDAEQDDSEKLENINEGDHNKLWYVRRKKGLVSYGQRWFRMASWAARLHTVKCWCTCGNGCCLSTCSCTLCGERISTPPSPLAFYFGSEKEKKATRKREIDEKGSTIHHSIGNGLPLFFFNDEVAQRRREMDTGSFSDHNSFCLCQKVSWTLVSLSKQLEGGNGWNNPLAYRCFWLMNGSYGLWRTGMLIII